MLLAAAHVLPVSYTSAGAQTSGDPICMVRADVGEGDAVVVVTASDIPGLEAKGFQRVACAGAFGSHVGLVSFRDAICTIASIPDKATQDTYEAQFGERPAVLCGMAERALGQWKRKGEN